MMSGQRAVWAAAFDRHLACSDGPEEAAYYARKAVEAMSAIDRSRLDDDTRAMLEDMLGVLR